MTWGVKAGRAHLVLTEALVVQQLIKDDDCARDDFVAEQGQGVMRASKQICMHRNAQVAVQQGAAGGYAREQGSDTLHGDWAACRQLWLDMRGVGC